MNEGEERFGTMRLQTSIRDMYPRIAVLGRISPTGGKYANSSAQPDLRTIGVAGFEPTTCRRGDRATRSPTHQVPVATASQNRGGGI